MLLTKNEKSIGFEKELNLGQNVFDLNEES